MCRAATSSWSGRSGAGGFTDGIRIRSPRVAISVSCAASQVASSSRAEGVVATRLMRPTG